MARCGASIVGPTRTSRWPFRRQGTIRRRGSRRLHLRRRAAMQSMLFVDTSGWYAAFNRADGAHSAIRQALAQARKARRAIVTSDYVIDETLTLVRMRAGHRLAVEVGEAVWRRGGAEIIDVDAAIRDA